MRHRIVILGAGYAGLGAAGYLARHLHPDDVEITVVNAEASFVDRIRLHQLVAGRDLRHHSLATIFANTGIRLRLARVTAVDAEHRTVTVVDDRGSDQLSYDTLLYTLGSTATVHSVPGVAEHAFTVADLQSASRLREHLDNLGGEGSALVVGGNLTAIETATEIAESRPGLNVTLATAGQLGGLLGARARRHLRRVFDRFGIETHEHATVESVTSTGAVTADGTVFDTDATIWTAGFTVHPIAAASGLEVQDDGRIIVDDGMRSVSHRDVYSAGDSSYTPQKNGQPLPMTCASAQFTRIRATAAIIKDLTGRKVQIPSPLVYLGNCISLGQRDAIVQVVGGDGHSKAWSLRGAPAAQIKAAVLATVPWATRHPTFGLPARSLRVLSAPRSVLPEVVVD